MYFLAMFMSILNMNNKKVIVEISYSNSVNELFFKE